MITKELKKYSTIQTVDWERCIAIPERYFSKIININNIENSSLEQEKLNYFFENFLKSNFDYPITYTTSDEEWVWETLDFWAEWVPMKDFVKHLRKK